jgi:uncharacterized phage-associated protein
MVRPMSSASPYDARAVANLLLDLAEARSVQLTQVSLLKLLYFAHGWYLAVHSKPLVSQDFEAWEHGPVVKVVRDAFRSFGRDPITTRATKLHLQSGEHVPVTADLDERDARFVQSIFEAYHVFDAWQLSDMTHEPGSPWDRLWNSREPVGRLALRIKNVDIQAHFTHFNRLPRRFRIS